MGGGRWGQGANRADRPPWDLTLTLGALGALSRAGLAGLCGGRPQRLGFWVTGDHKGPSPRRGGWDSG